MSTVLPAKKGETSTARPIVLQPAGWPMPKGYANGMAAEGRIVVTGGVVGWDTDGVFPAEFLGQVRQTLSNIVAILSEGGAGPEHLVRLTWYITDKREYVARSSEVGQAYRRVVGRHYPAMTLVQVAALLDDRAKVEIEATALVPTRAEVRS